MDEEHRGKRISQYMKETVIEYAKGFRFSHVYIPSDMAGFIKNMVLRRLTSWKTMAGDGLCFCKSNLICSKFFIRFFDENFHLPY